MAAFPSPATRRKGSVGAGLRTSFRRRRHRRSDDPSLIQRVNSMERRWTADSRPAVVEGSDPPPGLSRERWPALDTTTPARQSTFPNEASESLQPALGADTQSRKNEGGQAETDCRPDERLGFSRNSGDMTDDLAHGFARARVGQKRDGTADNIRQLFCGIETVASPSEGGRRRAEDARLRARDTYPGAGFSDRRHEHRRRRYEHSHERCRRGHEHCRRHHQRCSRSNQLCC